VHRFKHSSSIDTSYKGEIKQMMNRYQRVGAIAVLFLMVLGSPNVIADAVTEVPSVFRLPMGEQFYAISFFFC